MAILIFFMNIYDSCNTVLSIFRFTGLIYTSLYDLSISNLCLVHYKILYKLCIPLYIAIKLVFIYIIIVDIRLHWENLSCYLSQEAVLGNLLPCSILGLYYYPLFRTFYFQIITNFPLITHSASTNTFMWVLEHDYLC